MFHLPQKSVSIPAIRLDAPGAQEKLLMNRYNAQTYSGQILEAESGLRQAYEDANQPPVHPFSPLIGVWLADTLSIRGEMDEAASMATAAMRWSGIEPMGGRDVPPGRENE